MASTSSWRRAQRWLAVLAALAVVLGLSGMQAGAWAATSSNGPETRPFEPGEEGMAGRRPTPASNSPSRVPAAHVPTPDAAAGREQRRRQAPRGAEPEGPARRPTAATRFSLEPPDQASVRRRRRRSSRASTTSSRSTTRPGARTSGADVLRRLLQRRGRDRPHARTPSTRSARSSPTPSATATPQLQRFFMTDPRARHRPGDR